MNIRWNDLTSDENAYLDDVLDLYNRTFPHQVREPHHLFMKGLQIPKNHFHILIGLDGEKLVSFATGHYLEDVNTGFIVYIAINSSTRNIGLGSETLAQLENRFTIDAASTGNGSLRAIVLETEKLESAHSEIEREECLHRTRFFEKNDFLKTNDIIYLQPPLHDGEMAVPLNLFINEKLTKDEIHKIILSIYREKYSKVNGIHKDILNYCLIKIGIKKYAGTSNITNRRDRRFLLSSLVVEYRCLTPAVFRL